MAIRLSQHRLQATLLAGALLLATVIGAASALHSHAQLRRQQGAIVGLHQEAAEAERLLLLLADAQSAMRHWLLSGRLEDRDGAIRSGAALRDQGREVVRRLEPPLAARGLAPLGAPLEHVLRIHEHAQDLFESSADNSAPQAVLRSEAESVVQRIHGVLHEFRHKAQAELAMREAALQEGQMVGLLLIGGSSGATLVLLLGAIAMLGRRRSAAEEASAAMDARGREIATLFRMGELLQSSLSPEDIRRVVSHTARELLPKLGGAFYVFNNSRDRLDLLGAWGAGEAAVAALPEHFGPNECWALKRGRPHGCGLGGGLLCEHATGTGTCGLCVPMHARGEVYGVLKFIPPADHDIPSTARRELAYALADGVSLALANLALREKLRNQAMRDELTGLQNRRFLEEMLPRLVAHAERRGAPIAVLMLDLDHFKQVNDRYGHATGDAVLREVGALLLARLRRMDMACRYGGEELLVVMPDCTAQEALVRAQELCGNIRALRDRADNGLPPVTVSIGVAAWPEHGEQLGKVIEAADAALYAAKRGGRDRAMPAEATMAALPMPG
ncbi:diguanylate cyclase [Falsiroseomonas sp.]|uniref:sensor domain-containing diguanylate cyclase n=1 Tax=Falsiroseomonas sp. TaxID=2870721 RepID=UPI0035698814